MFLLPIGHEDLSVRRLPWVTIGIAVICTLVQLKACYVELDTHDQLLSLSRELYEVRGDAEAVAEIRARADQALADHPVYRFGYKPSEPSVFRIFTSLFTHGGWMHLIGNMLFLYLVGVSIEDRWGRWRFLVFYLLGGAAATLAYHAAHVGSPTPLVGASGAIAAAMGGFVILYARTKIKFFYLWWFLLLRTGTFSAPAWLVLPLWFLQQILSISAETSGVENVGYSAHAGGFIFGALVAVAIRLGGWDKKFVRETDVASGGWVEDPVLEEVRALAAKNQLRPALGKLSELLARKPQDKGARELAYDLAERSGNAMLMIKHGDHLFGEWAKFQPQRVLEAFDKIAAAAGEGAVDERIIEHTLNAAATANDLGRAQSATRQLFKFYPGSVRIARGLWVMAEIHNSHGRIEQANMLLERLVRDFPQGPLAERARQKLSVDFSVPDAETA